MTFHILTAILVVLKALNYIDWSWWLVLAPSIFAFVMGNHCVDLRGVHRSSV